MTEQIDALEAMAFNPIAFLVVPRIIAAAVMVPVLTIFSAAIAILSGLITSVSLADITAFEFIKGLRMHAQAHDFILALSKSVLFGIAIVSVACYQGLNAKQGAEGVGKAATKFGCYCQFNDPDTGFYNGNNCTWFIKNI